MELLEKESIDFYLERDLDRVTVCFFQGRRV